MIERPTLGRSVVLDEGRDAPPRRRTPAGSPGAGDPAPLLLVRLRHGIVGESRRVVHVVPVPTDGVPAALTAYCGERIAPGTAEVLPGPSGVPCTPCLAAMPLPEHPEPHARN